MVHEIPCCKHLMMRHSNLTTDRLMLSSLARQVLTRSISRLSGAPDLVPHWFLLHILTLFCRGGRGVWQSKHGTVIHFSVRDRQWQVSTSLEESSAWSYSSSTALCPGEAARQSQFQWRGDRLEVVCS